MTKLKAPHLDPLALAHLLRQADPLAAGQLHHFVSHLVAGCGQCIETLRQLTEVDPLEADEERLEEDRETDVQFEAALEASGVLDRARETTQEDNKQFEEELASARAELLSSEASYSKTWASCELLLQGAQRIWSQDPSQAASLLQLAIDIASALDVGRYGAPNIADLHARIFAYLANVYRITDDHVEADLWFAEALQRLEEGSGEPLARASVNNLLASFRRDQQRFGESQALLEEVVATYREAGNLHNAGRALIKQATVAQCLGAPTQAIRLLKSAEPLLDYSKEPRLELMVAHNRITLLAETPEGAKEARRLLREKRHLYERLGGDVYDSRLPWTKGRIALGLGELDHAETFLLQAQKALVESSNPQIWAYASLDLAAVFALQMRFTELEELAQNILETFMNRGLHQSTFATLLLLVKSAQAKNVTVEMLRSTALALRRAPKPSNASPA